MEEPTQKETLQFQGISFLARNKARLIALLTWVTIAIILVYIVLGILDKDCKSNKLKILNLVAINFGIGYLYFKLLHKHVSLSDRTGTFTGVGFVYKKQIKK